MRWLVGLVVAMGVLIIAGLAVIGITLFHRMTGPHPASPVAAPAVAPGLAPPNPGEIDLPPGSRIEGMAGVGDRLVLRLILPDGANRLLTLDPVTGRVVGSVDLARPGPAENSR